MTTTYENYKIFSLGVSTDMKDKLKEISGMNIEKVMSDVENLLTNEYKIHYADNDSIMIKVDRRKNVNVIIESIEELVKTLVGEDKYDLIFKTRVSDGMVTIKRRR